MADVHIGNAPPNRAVLPFYATGAVFFLVFSVLLLWAAGDLLGHYFQPHLLAIVHCAALGWGTMIIFGSGYQLMPVICERNLSSPNLAFVSYFLLTSGTLLLIYSFWNFHTGWWMISGGVLVVSAAVCYFVNALRTSGVCGKHTIQRCFIISSGAWLVLTTLVGLLLAINLRYPFLAGNHLDTLKLHAHAGLGGWFLQLITGVSIKLVPMFLLSRSDREKWLRYAYIFQNAGLILYIGDTFLNGPSPRGLLWEGLILAGTVTWLSYIFDVFRKRVKKKVDWQMKHTFVSFVCLFLAAAMIPALYFSHGVHWSVAAGALLFMGWISSIILGQTFKTLPFTLWNSKYKKVNGLRKIAMPKDMYSERILRLQFYTFIAALVLLIPGILFGYVLVVRSALACWLAMALLYAFNVLRTFTHKSTKDHEPVHQ